MPDAAHRRAALPTFMRVSVRWGLLMNEVFGIGDPLRGVAIWAPPGMVNEDLDPDDSIVRYGELLSATWGRRRSAARSLSRGAAGRPRCRAGSADVVPRVARRRSRTATLRRRRRAIARHVHAARLVRQRRLSRNREGGERPVLRTARLQRGHATVQSPVAGPTSGRCAARPRCRRSPALAPPPIRRHNPHRRQTRPRRLTTDDRRPM